MDEIWGYGIFRGLPKCYWIGEVKSLVKKEYSKMRKKLRFVKVVSQMSTAWNLGFDDLLDILATSQSKLDVERHLLDMISNDPVEAATALSSLFEHNTPREQFKTRHELIDLMVKDPVAVTSVSTINSEFTFTHLRIYCWC